MNTVSAFVTKQADLYFLSVKRAGITDERSILVAVIRKYGISEDNEAQSVRISPFNVFCKKYLWRRILAALSPLRVICFPVFKSIRGIQL